MDTNKQTREQWTALHCAVLSKYGAPFIKYANLWELERALEPDELAVAREIRMEGAREVARRIGSKADR